MREVRSFGGVEVGEDFEDRRNLGSQDLVSFESSILSADEKCDTLLAIEYFRDIIVAENCGE